MSVGYSGTGSFAQSGGTNCIGFWLNLGNQAGGYGAYNLSGSGLLLVDSVLDCQENVGLSGTGSFMQTGGTNICSYLAIGEYAGSSGTYSLSGGYLSVDLAPSRPRRTWATPARAFSHRPAEPIVAAISISATEPAAEARTASVAAASCR